MRQKLNWMVVLLVVLACGAVAQANTLPIGPGDYNTTLAAWATIPTIQQVDKNWTYLVSSGTVGGAPFDLGSLPLSFSMQAVNGRVDHTLNMANAQNYSFPVGSYNLQYEISVQPGYNLWFLAASLGDNLVGSPATATIVKTLTNANNPSQVVTLTSTNGATDSTDAFRSIVGWTDITVNEQINVTSGVLNNVSSTFVETVPEPSTIALLGVAFVGLLGYVRGRKRAA